MAGVRDGGCQCGAVRYQVIGEPIAISVCHCGECQRQSGSAFGMSWIVRQSEFRLLQGKLKTFTRSSDSGRPVECAFCPECGTRIYHVPRYIDGVFNVKPGTLDDTSCVQPNREVWAVRRQRWLQVTGELKSYEGQPY